MIEENVAPPNTLYRYTVQLFHRCTGAKCSRAVQSFLRKPIVSRILETHGNRSETQPCAIPSSINKQGAESRSAFSVDATSQAESASPPPFQLAYVHVCFLFSLSFASFNLSACLPEERSLLLRWLAPFTWREREPGSSVSNRWAGGKELRDPESNCSSFVFPLSFFYPRLFHEDRSQIDFSIDVLPFASKLWPSRILKRISTVQLCFLFVAWSVHSRLGFVQWIVVDSRGDLLCRVHVPRTGIAAWNVGEQQTK